MIAEAGHFVVSETPITWTHDSVTTLAAGTGSFAVGTPDILAALSVPVTPGSFTVHIGRTKLKVRGGHIHHAAMLTGLGG